MSRVYEIDPLRDDRWDGFLERQSQASLFHSTPWLRALKETYDFQTGAFTTSAPGHELTNALVFCRVKSWLTGRRIVSLPFSDHCAPLVRTDEDLGSLLAHLYKEGRRGREKYVEVRSDPSAVYETAGLSESANFCWHRLDLRPSEGELFQAFHPSCIQRKIHKAQQEGITYHEGRSEELLRAFYRLTILTRRRHEVTPQPLRWFRNLSVFFGDRLKIRTVFQHRQPAAAILTIRYKDTMTYKYGGSDARFHKLGPMQLLFWKTIQEAKREGLSEFDLGRTDWTNNGLLAFKDRLGCMRLTLRYAREPVLELHQRPGIPRNLVKRLFVSAPDAFLTAAGTILYRHFA